MRVQRTKSVRSRRTVSHAFVSGFMDGFGGIAHLWRLDRKPSARVFALPSKGRDWHKIRGDFSTVLGKFDGAVRQ